MDPLRNCAALFFHDCGLSSWLCMAHGGQGRACWLGEQAAPLCARAPVTAQFGARAPGKRCQFRRKEANDAIPAGCIAPLLWGSSRLSRSSEVVERVLPRLQPGRRRALPEEVVGSDSEDSTIPEEEWLRTLKHAPRPPPCERSRRASC